jgi:NADH-quinone oxidoreductase subunit G
MPTFRINGMDTSVEEGMTVFEAAARLGIEIPHFCYHNGLSVAGNCRICQVEVEGVPKMQISCALTPTDGMVVWTESEKCIKAREATMEFLLINHPLDCPVCDKAGECALQDYSYKHGAAHSRFEELKRTPSQKKLGSGVLLWTTRCIQCSRCIRFFEEVTGTSELCFTNRGNHVEVSTAPNKLIDNLMAGNVADICPVGALVTEDFLFSARTWNLKTGSTICPHCAKGCSIQIEHRDNAVKRVKPRVNPDVNGNWMCDVGRYSYNEVAAQRRIPFPEIRFGGKRKRTDWDRALNSVAEALKPHRGRIGVLATSHLSNEALYALSRFTEEPVGARIFAADPDPTETIEYKAWRIPGDRTPNRSGLRLILREHGTVSELVSALSDGSITAVVVCLSSHEYAITDDDARTVASADVLVSLNWAYDDLTESAGFVLPMRHPYEANGSFTNFDGRVQSTSEVLTPPGGAKHDWEAVGNLAGALGIPGLADKDNHALFADLSATVDAFSGMSYPALGVVKT